MLSNIKKIPSPLELKKILKESVAATRTVTKNMEIIETLVSMSEIKAGRYKQYSSAKELFKKLGI